MSNFLKKTGPILGIGILGGCLSMFILPLTIIPLSAVFGWMMVLASEIVIDPFLGCFGIAPMFSNVPFWLWVGIVVVWETLKHYIFMKPYKQYGTDEKSQEFISRQQNADGFANIGFELACIFVLYFLKWFIF